MRQLEMIIDSIRIFLYRRPRVRRIIEILTPSFYIAKIRLNDTLKQEKNILDGIRLKKGWVFVDVGAYVGFYTIWASNRVGKEGSIIAIEPAPKNFKLLLYNVRKLKNVCLLNIALWKQNTVLNLYLSRNPSMHSVAIRSDKYIKVKALTLDSLMKLLKISHVDAVKIDVEGAELEVLNGGEKAFKTLKLILIEVHGKDLEERCKVITDILKSESFKVKRLSKQHILAERE